MEEFIKLNYSNMFYNKGNDLKELNKREEAIKAYNHAISLCSKNSDAFLN